MFFREHNIPPRIAGALVPIGQLARRLDIFDFIVLIGLSSALPINLFSFVDVSDVLLFFFICVIVPYVAKHSGGFYFGKEHILITIYAIWAYCTYLLNPLHEGISIGWGMYMMPALMFISFSQVIYLSKKDRGLEKGWIIWGLFIAFQLLLSLDLTAGINVGLHFKANIYWARSNYIAAVLEIPILWCYHLMQQDHPRKRLAMLAFVICVFALVLTVSRGGILTILLSFVLYSVLKKKFFWLLFVAIAAAVLYPRYSARFGDMLDESNLDRIYLWLQSLELALKSPIIGYGPGNLPLYSTLFSMSDFMTDPHNFILTILLHTGAVGLILFIFLMVIFIRRAVFIYKKQKNPFFIVVIFSAFFHGMVEPTFLGYTYSFLFWYSMVMLTVQAQQLTSVVKTAINPRK
jgi:O-antigen ligase